MIFCLCNIACSGNAADAGPSDLEFFERRIRPVLVQHCYECHSAGSSSLEGGLQLDFREGLLKGGDSGAALVPGHPEKSLLLGALRHESFAMPPAGKLSDAVIRNFEHWIERGAVDPRDQPPSATEAAEAAWKAKLIERRQWWSLQPPQEQAPPRVDDAEWMKNPVDRFIRAKLDDAGLTPAAPAEPEVLLRRLSFLLTGLPPKPERVLTFREQWQRNRNTALSELVEELLDSPHFGERFARHWMDVVRYTDTYGYEWDIAAKGSWEYRDYLIRAFNNDIGFDQLIREHIAGDLLPDPRIHHAAGFHESMIGPMFFHFGERRHGSSLDFNGIHQEMVDSQIDAFSKAFLGMTVACARCHDHKLDAISQRDYYALASVFMTPRWTSRSIDAPGKYAQQIEQLKQLRSEIQEVLGKSWQTQLNEMEMNFADVAKRVNDDSSVESISGTLTRLFSDVTWAKSENVQASAENAATRLIVEEDGMTIRAEGDSVPSTDAYTVTFSTSPGPVTLLRIEALTHSSLGSGGPGRTQHGNFVLSRIGVQVKSPGEVKARDIVIRAARADYEQPGYPVAAALDSSTKGWGVGLGGNVDRSAQFSFAEPVLLPDGGEWIVTLEFQLGSGHSLGRLRISPGTEIDRATRSNDVVQKRWVELANEWKSERSRRIEQNKKFQVLSDLSEPGFPEDWVIEGAGLQNGWVSAATPLIALTGDEMISRFLPRGYHTHALSSKLPGALRLPEPCRFPQQQISLRLSGGEWAGYRSIPQNAFLSEGPAFFDPHAEPTWKTFSATPLKNGVTRVLTEISTADLNANFPPRTGVARMGNVTLPNNDDGHDKRSWFSLTGILAHDQPGQPVDELDSLTTLYREPLPSTMEAIEQRVTDWMLGAVQRWTEFRSKPGDEKLLNWLLENGVLKNDLQSLTEVASLVKRYREIEATIDFPHSANSMDERGVETVNYRLNIRGDVYDEGPAVAPDFLEVFAGEHHLHEHGRSPRLELANYLASHDNPQTARVFVNRIWQWIFGTGIVDTPNDFGKLGGRPSHPELLDWLAIRFMDDGWSTKQLIRRLVLSRAFQQGGEVTLPGDEIDPGNRLLHHYPTRRLEAEAIRDNLLAVSGRLDTSLFGRPVRPHRVAEDDKKRLFSGPLDGGGRRSIYLEMSVMQPPEFLVGFNLPDLKFPAGRRDVTNVPAQALILLNNPFVALLADEWSESLMNDGLSAPADRISLMFLAALGRSPSEVELQRWLLAAQDFSSGETNLMHDRLVWSSLAHALFNTKEFLYFR